MDHKKGLPTKHQPVPGCIADSPSCLNTKEINYQDGIASELSTQPSIQSLRLSKQCACPGPQSLGPYNESPPIVDEKEPFAKEVSGYCLFDKIKVIVFCSRSSR